MMTPIKAWAFAALVASPLMFGVTSLAQAQVKTAKACDEEYKTQKAAVKAAKETKKDFVAACKALPVGQPTPVGTPAAPATTGAAATPAAPAAGATKTSGACDDEYKANKGALKSAKETKKAFIAACRALPPGQPDAARRRRDARHTPRVAGRDPDASRTGTGGARNAARSSAPDGLTRRARAASHPVRWPGGRQPVRHRSGREGAVPVRHSRLGQHRIQGLPFRRDQELREHEEGRLHVRDRRHVGRRPRLEDGEAPVGLAARASVRVRAALERFPEKSTDFSDEKMLQFFLKRERFLIGQLTPPDR